MPRTVKEWIGKTDDSDPPDYIKRRVAVSANYSCRICTRECKWGRGDTDHKKPIWDGGENRESNLQWVCRTPCHRRKTTEEAAQRAKAHKTQKRVAGIKKQSDWSRNYHKAKERGYDPWRKVKWNPSTRKHEPSEETQG